ncbi:MAG: alpha-1,4-glucan--maltose-1-phosphate maltosyltransferase [Rhizobiales bacterium]|nr:alpha-1,4-glucan--maltose-1-phosphate maltosyltransferase [Hyphomicrobiales bacterium]
MRQPWAASAAQPPDIAEISPGVAALDVAPADPTGPRFRIEDIYPSIDGGRYPAKRIAGEPVDIWADIFREGHDVLAAALLWRREDHPDWQRVPMEFVSNDRWHARFTPQQPGYYLLTVEAWSDQFATWRKEIQLKRKAGLPTTLERDEGIMLARQLAGQDPRVSQAIRTAQQDSDPSALLDDALADTLRTPAQRPDLTRGVIPLLVDPPIARAGAWYEMVPRSQGTVAGRHGTFDDCIARLPDIATLGFDVVYLPPIHPIGETNRKGRNNAVKAAPGDPGSMYAIGSTHGGHDAVHPELGTLDDFRRFVAACRQHGLQVALDFAIQCSPDHPWLKQHPDWFTRRSDGSIRYAENPPKKYEDIVNPDFYCADRIALWEALRDVILFWVKQGVHIFRVDNPHTKPFPFWEWMIREVRLREPSVIFLSEAFTRPKVMKGLAKIGFNQSYSYFTWRTTKAELQEYLTELTSFPTREYFRANFFVTTPDILPVQLQTGEAWLFKARFALAATLSSNYGIYNGFELIEHEPLPGREEYLDSEKYEIKVRDWSRPGNIKPYIAALNRIRRDNPALLQTNDLTFVQIDDPQVIGFVKESVDHANAVAVAIALSPGPHEFWFHFGDIQIGPEDARAPIRAIENLVTGERHLLEWGGIRLRIDTSNDPALLFRCYA